MSWFKSSFIIFNLILTTSLWAGEFTAKECLNADYKTLIKHEGKFFGLLKSSLSIEKSKCIIDVSFKQVLKTRWLIDVCREPIHMKVTSKGSQSVYKRSGKCHKSSNNDYCSFYQHLNEVIQDHGLIFAEGDRESLDTAHGQTYCAHLLLKKHLEEGMLYSLYKDPAEFTQKAIVQEKKPIMNENIPQLKPMDSNSSVESTPAISAPKEEDIF